MRFSRRSAENIEWIRVGKHMDNQAKMIRKMLQRYHSKNKKRNRENLTDMIDLGHYDDIDIIQAHLDEANRLNDLTPLIRAYIKDTEFCSRLNLALATVQDLNSHDPKQRQLLNFLEIICCHRTLNKYEIRLTTYRGMQLTREEFEKYQAGSKIMTKTLLSTSQKKEKALQFTMDWETTNDNNNIIPCLCIYHIRKSNTALAVQDLSVFQDEEEVLISPYSAFEVMNIGMITTEFGRVTTIELRQCRLDIPTYTLIAAGGGILAATKGRVAYFSTSSNFG